MLRFFGPVLQIPKGSYHGHLFTPTFILVQPKYPHFLQQFLLKFQVSSRQVSRLKSTIKKQSHIADIWISSELIKPLSPLHWTSFSVDVQVVSWTNVENLHLSPPKAIQLVFLFFCRLKSVCHFWQQVTVYSYRYSQWELAKTKV